MITFIHQFLHDYIMDTHVSFCLQRQVGQKWNKTMFLLWNPLVAVLTNVEETLEIKVAVFR